MFPCPLPAQRTDTVFTWTDAAKTTWQRRCQTDIARQAATPEYLFPRGEIRLKRLKSTELHYVFPADTDTIRVLVTNKDGIPFQQVEWQFETEGQPDVQENTAAFERTFPRSRQAGATLRINPSFSLQRQVAVVQVQQIKPSLAAVTHIVVTDSLISTTDSNLTDHIRKSAPAGKTIPNNWARKALLSPGLRLVQTGALVVKQHPAQKKQLVPSGQHRLSRWGATRHIPYSDFKQGDTLIFSVTAQKTPLREIYLTGGRDSLMNRAINTLVFTDTVVINTETTLTLHLKSKAALKKNTPLVSVLRIRPVRPDSAYAATDTLFRSESTPLYDTLLLTVADDSLLLTPVWNIEDEPFGQLEVQMPDSTAEGHRFMYAAWWLGIGRASLNEYLALEASVPAVWSKPGAPVALGAYGLGHSLILPEIPAGEVYCKFSRSKTPPKALAPLEQAVSPSQKRVKKGSQKPLDGLPGGRNAGILQADSFHASWSFPGKSRATGIASHNFYACFQNTGTVNSYPIALKVVGFYRKVTPQPAKPLEPMVKTYKIPLAK